MLRIEWINCADIHSEPTRCSVVSSAGGHGVAWIYDSQQVFVIPLVNRIAVLRDMAPFDRCGVRVIGTLTPASAQSLRKAMANFVEIRIASSHGWEDAILDSPDDGLRMPSMDDGWFPISLMDGTYWKFPSRSGSH